MRIPFDGHSSQMISCCGANADGIPITDFSGINPLKFGFFTEQKTYQYFDKTINKATSMDFKDVETIDGVEVYKFVQVIEPTQIGTLEVPGDLVGSTDAAVQAPGVLRQHPDGLGRAHHRRDRQGQRAAEADPAWRGRHRQADPHRGDHRLHRRERAAVRSAGRRRQVAARAGADRDPVGRAGGRARPAGPGRLAPHRRAARRSRSRRPRRPRCASRNPRPSRHDPARPRRSPSPAASGRAAATSRPRPARARRATPARPGRAARSPARDQRAHVVAQRPVVLDVRRPVPSPSVSTYGRRSK